MTVDARSWFSRDFRSARTLPNLAPDGFAVKIVESPESDQKPVCGFLMPLDTTTQLDPVLSGRSQTRPEAGWARKVWRWPIEGIVSTGPPRG